MSYYIGAIVGAIVFIIVLRSLLTWLESRDSEKYRQREIARCQREWNALTPQQQRARWLGNFYIPENYLPYVVIRDDGKAGLPNFYLGQGIFDMESFGFTEEEIKIARNFASMKTWLTAA